MSFVRHFIILFCVFIIQLASAADVPTKRMRLNEFYTVVPMPRNPQMDSSWWGLKAALDAKSAGADTCDELLAHFNGAEPAATKHGVFVHSYTHSIVYSQSDLKKQHPSIIAQLKHQGWRALENRMVSDLVTVANTKRIPVWVLVKATGDLYTYKLVTDPQFVSKK